MSSNSQSTSATEFTVTPSRTVFDLEAQIHYHPIPTTADFFEPELELDDEDPLPPYIDAQLPDYTPRAEEPLTLAMYLFKFGFLFPPFWILGIIVLYSPLREPESVLAPSPASPAASHQSASPSSISPQWMPDKTPAERAAILAEMRRVEMKWAHRCFVAFSVFTCVAIGMSVSVLLALRYYIGN